MIKAEKVHDEIYTARDFSSSPLTISDLDGDSYDYELVMVFDFSSATSNDLKLAFNSDTTANYRNYFIRGYSTTKNAGVSNSQSFIETTKIKSGTIAFCKSFISGSSGDERYINTSAMGANSANKTIRKISSYWKNTADNLTSITISYGTSANSEAHIMLYRTPKASEQSNWELMQTLEWSAETAEKSFSGLLGGTDKKYKIAWQGTQELSVQINNDGGANYARQYLQNSAGALSANNVTTNTSIITDGIESNVFINAETGVKRLCKASSSNTSAAQQSERSIWYSNTATEVTSLDCTPAASATGTAKLYRKIEPSTTGDTLPFELMSNETFSSTDFSAGTTHTILGDSINLLKIEGLLSNASGDIEIRMQLNSDTAANYPEQLLKGDTSTVTAAIATRAYIVLAKLQNSNQSEFTVYVYTKSGGNRVALTRCGYDENAIEFLGQWWSNSASEITTAKIYASSANAITGDIKVSRLLSTPPPSLFSLNTALLDGSTQYFAAGNPAALQITGDFTASIWVKMDAVSGSSQVFFSKSNSTSNEQSWMIYYTGGVTEFRGAISTNGSAFDVAPEGGVPVVSTWYNLVLTYDGSNARLYTNGVLDDAPAYTAGINNSTANVRVGRRGDSASELYFDGSVAFPKIWDRALPQAEVTELYNGGNPKCFDLLGSGLKTNLVYSPTLSNWNGATGSELVDNSVSSITTTNQGTTPFTGTGLSVNCNS